jgi:myo-inositol-1(or 4)-monophosphatase
MNDFEKYFKIAEAINGEVSEFLLSRFGSVKKMSHKVDSHYGISEDLESNKMYEDFLKIKTPEASLFTEEGERNLKNDLVWVIDPIEGTSNYRAGNPFWATQIALLYKNKPVLGIVNAPVLKQKFYAGKDKGAFLNGKKIKTSLLKDLSKALIDMGRGTKDADKDWFNQALTKISKKIRTNRVFGACGLSISFVAAGMTDAFFNSGAEIYDLSAGAIIAKEAGAETVNFTGKDWKITDKTFLVASKTLAHETLKIIV